MPKVVGTVGIAEPKFTKGGKKYFRVQVGNNWYSMWETPDFSIGDTIEFDDIQKGDFHNIANAVKVERGAQSDDGWAGSPPVQTRRPNGSFDADREPRIVRQNATSSAVALVAASKLAGKSDVETLLGVVKDTAKRIFEMNMYGYDAKEKEVDPTSAAKEEGVWAGAESLFKY